MREIEHLDFAAPSSGWPAGRDHAALHDRRGRAGPASDAQGWWRPWRRPSSGTTSACSPRPTAAARDYLRSRGIDGEHGPSVPARLGARRLGRAGRTVCSCRTRARDTGLAFLNRRDRLQDTFRARILFPIFNEAGEPVAFGGRVLPGSTDPAKYKNSPETPIYGKSKVLYGLNWAKSEHRGGRSGGGVRGLHGRDRLPCAGVPIAVATCGTALTADHVRLLKRFASKVVLAFDADAAGQGAAARFYEWERKYEVAVEVARLPRGKDPGDLAREDPDALRRRSRRRRRSWASAWVGCYAPGAGRHARGQGEAGQRRHGHGQRAPDVNVRSSTPARWRAHRPAGSRLGEGGGAPGPGGRGPGRAGTARPAGERRVRGAGAADPALGRGGPVAGRAAVRGRGHLGAFRALAEVDGDVHKAIERADPEVRDLLERLSVADVDADSQVEVRNLVGAATRRQLEELRADRT